MTPISQFTLNSTFLTVTIRLTLARFDKKAQKGIARALINQKFSLPHPPPPLSFPSKFLECMQMTDSRMVP